jgi:hypothetical protein
MIAGCYLVLMNFGDGGNLVGNLVSELNEEMAMEWINDKSF